MEGLVQNRSKPVKKKPSCSSAQGSRPGELSSSPPLKKPASDGMLDSDYETYYAGQTLTDKELLKVAETLGQEWEQAAIHLGLKTKDLDDIKAKHRSVAIRKYKMLMRWKRQRQPGEATAQDLLRGLDDLDLAVETRQLLKELEMIGSKFVYTLSDHNIIDLLFYLNVLNDEEKKTIEGQMTSEDKARCLIDTVMKKGEGASSLMVDYLTKEHPELCSTLGLTPTPAWSKLGKIRSKFINMLPGHVVIDLLCNLWEDGVLNDEEKKIVEGKMTKEDKTRCLIDTVMRKGERASSPMVDYLKGRHPDVCSTLGLTPNSARMGPLKLPLQEPLMTSGSSRQWSLSRSELSGPVDSESSLPFAMPGSTQGLVQNRSNPVKRKPSCSSGRGSCPGELSPYPPLKMPKSDNTQDISDLIDQPLPGPSLAEDTASMPVVDRCGEEDGSDSEEMHVKSQREKCKAAQQSPEYEKVTPREISKWSFE